jgi:hypothetical protein
MAQRVPSSSKQGHVREAADLRSFFDAFADEEPDAAGWLAAHLSRDQRTNGCSMMLGGG